MAYKYNAFISYNHDDIKIAKYVQKILETGISRSGSIKSNSSNSGRVRNSDNKKDLNTKRKWPKLEIFRDETHLVAGELDEGIRDAIKQSEFLIVICSENAVKSQYVHLELGLFLRNFAGDTPEGWHKALKNVLFVGCDNSLAKNKNVIRTLIKKAFKGDPNEEEVNALINEARESLFANFGSQKDANIFNKRQKKREEVYMLAGKIMGVDKNQLSRRSERRHRAILSLVAIFLLVIASLIYASITSLQQVWDRDARRLALVAESQLKEGDRPLAAEIALESAKPKFFYRKITPQAISVMVDATKAYEMSSDLIFDKSGIYNIANADSVSMDVSSDGHYLAAVNNSNDHILWDVEKKEQLVTLSSALHEIQSKVAFIGEDKLLSYAYDVVECFSLPGGERIWENKIDTNLTKLNIGNQDGVLMSTTVTNEDYDGLANIRELDLDSRKVLIFVEVKNGLVLRNVDDGSIIKQLKRDKIDKLLPEKTLFHKDISYYPVRMISQLQSPEEIGYDAERGTVIIPCYKKEQFGGKDGYIEELVNGILKWNPDNGKTKYVALDNSVYGNEEYVLEKDIFYPCSGVIIKTSSVKNSQKLWAFDTDSGKLLWNKSVTLNNDVRSAGKSVCCTQQGLAVIDGNNIIILDPVTGREQHKVHPDLIDWNGEYPFMILGDDSTSANDITSLKILTSLGRVCSFKNEDGQIGVVSGEINENVDKDEISNMSSCLYIPPEQSFTGTGQLFCYREGKIRQYEIGFTNDAYKFLAAIKGKPINDINPGDMKVFSVDDDRCLIKDEDSIWHLYDTSGDEPNLLWSVSPEDIEKVRSENYSGSNLEKYFRLINYVGTDPGSGKLMFYHEDLYEFIEMDQETGEIALVMSSEAKDALRESKEAEIHIIDPVITQTGLNYILEVNTPERCTYTIYHFDLIEKTYQKIILPEVSGELDEVSLVADRKGRINIIFGLPAGPLLADFQKGNDCPYLNYAEDGDSQREYMNSYFVDNRRDKICKFNENETMFAINYFPANRVILYDISGKPIAQWSYFNSIITDMYIDDSSLVLLTDEGKIKRFSLKNMKLQKTTTLQGKGSHFKLMDKPGRENGWNAKDNSIWVKDNYNTLYCIDLEDLVCKQQIKNVFTTDIYNNKVIVFKVDGDEITLESIPVCTDEEIIAKAKAFVGTKTMSQEDKVNYGIE